MAAKPTFMSAQNTFLANLGPHTCYTAKVFICFGLMFSVRYLNTNI